MPAFGTLWWWLEDQMGQHVFKSCELFASCVCGFQLGCRCFPSVFWWNLLLVASF